MKNYLTKKLTVGLASLILLSGVSLSASAATVIGGALNQADADQLESWLGQGAIDLTELWSGPGFARSTGWHRAVNGAGPTFSIYDVTYGEMNYSVGGYTAADWTLDWNGADYRVVDSEAFMFNLTTGVKHLPEAGASYSINTHSNLFPTFGLNGIDLLSGGDVLLNFHPILDVSIIGGPASIADFQINSLTTYSVTSAVPEPSVIAMMSLGLGLVGFMSVRRRKSEAVG